MTARDSRLRILFVDTELVWRGGQEQLFSLIVGMRDRGHSVSLAAPPGALLADRVKSRGVPCFDFRQRNEFSPMAFFRLLQIQRHGFDIVHFNTPRSMVAGSLAAWAAGTSRKICSRRVNFPLRSVFSRLKYNLFLNRIVTVSETIRQTLIEDGVRPQLISVIYEGVDVEWIDTLESPGLALGGEGPVVGTVAHLSREKGHATLLKAARGLVQRFPEARYVLVGDGPLKEDLSGLARQLGLEQSVVFTDFRHDSEALMKEFDIFCLPSLSEGLSSAILAAMANRLPVVATDVGGIPELVVDGVTGYLVPPGDPERLGTAIATLLESKALRTALGQAGRDRIEGRFTLSQKLDRSEALFRELLKNARFG